MQQKTTINLHSFPLALPLMMLTCFIINPFNTQFLRAQEIGKTEAKTVFHLSPEQTKVLEGVFQNPRNNEMYVQFSAKENSLIAKLLWNNNEIQLTPESELSFISTEAGEEGPVRIKFIKDSAGNISRVSIGKNELWNKVKDYKPVVKKEMDHTPGQLMPFEGVFQFSQDKGRFIQFSVKENKLILKQYWDGTEIPFVPISELDFFSKMAPLFSLSFTRDKDGKIIQALVFKKDKWDRVNKIPPTIEQLKAVQGKYQFKDDMDNFIQVTVKNHSLIVKQLWDGKEITLEPITETYFYNSDQSYPFQIIKDESGAVKQVMVLGIDLFDKVKE